MVKTSINRIASIPFISLCDVAFILLISLMNNSSPAKESTPYKWNADYNIEILTDSLKILPVSGEKIGFVLNNTSLSEDSRKHLSNILEPGMRVKVTINQDAKYGPVWELIKLISEKQVICIKDPEKNEK